MMPLTPSRNDNLLAKERFLATSLLNLATFNPLLAAVAYAFETAPCTVLN